MATRDIVNMTSSLAKLSNFYNMKKYFNVYIAKTIVAHFHSKTPNLISRCCFLLVYSTYVAHFCLESVTTLRVKCDTITKNMFYTLHGYNASSCLLAGLQLVPRFSKMEKLGSAYNWWLLSLSNYGETMHPLNQHTQHCWKLTTIVSRETHSENTWLIFTTFVIGMVGRVVSVWRVVTSNMMDSIRAQPDMKSNRNAGSRCASAQALR